jgi:3,5-epimerase/4-reductase
MKILVYGHKGWIGQQFIDLLKKKSDSYILGNSRVDDIKSLESEIDDIKPTHIVSFIGRTHGRIDDKEYSTIDYLEQKGKLVENVRDNLFAPISLALMCKKRNIHYTYLGTGCIYTYENNVSTKEPNVLETTLPNFKGSKYSLVKSYTNNLINMLPVLHLRIRMPITSEKSHRNLIDKIVNYKKIWGKWAPLSDST